MSLSFSHELKAAIPEYVFGINRVKHINKALSDNPGWRSESFTLLKGLLSKMISKDASDLDFGGPRSKGMIWYRVYGDKKPDPEAGDIFEDEAITIALSILSSDQKKLLISEKNLDFALSVKLDETQQEYRFRGNIFFERNYLAVNLRVIKQKLFSMDNLGIPAPIIKRLDLQHEKSGLFLITGITGSGKSSTLDAVIDMNNHNNNSHIIIIGNPIEFIHTSDKSIVSHREVGSDVKDFQRGTIESLRQDPDIIVVGEMRDSKTISTVLEVTDSGHKVFSTLHTSSTIDSIHRIIAEFPPDEQERIRYRLADVLKVVISQKLVPNKHNKLTLAKEVLSVDYSIQAAIRNGNITELFQMLTEGKSKGMFTMQQDLYRLYKAGIITVETAMNYCNNKKVMSNLLKYST
ncbi:MAG: Flp pilus assembly complex ATPase component TadA [Candidatus Cloacimonetes bacterium]|jgi:twitching motility protein PilT|nr:Flp pilus assembly complex ATPase component TadA [Candidatus Cloacimonadota bacterium]MBT4333480.1 Flp pilus assembly complex ATPase component TadA [Candidatus Cloacimonadota bacterium]MBT4576287.1 Flp pilus assembly complex ATPase component TadA [Candidatus Cloacimonadota bacterium]